MNLAAFTLRSHPENSGRRSAFLACVLGILPGVPNSRSAAADEPAPSDLRIHRVNYHGWADSIVLDNGVVEAVVVPAIGRIMQFRFAGEADGPLWENRALDGKTPDPQSAEWGNFGGDKTWPAPQDDWIAVAKRKWPPPPAFDSMPVEATVEGSAVVLTSPIDPFYGIRARRRIELQPGRPAMTVATSYEKMEGAPCRVSIWVIAQLKDPVAVFAPLPEKSVFPLGYDPQSEPLPAHLKVADGFLSLARNPKDNCKIGCDAGALIWIGATQALRLDSPRVLDAEYPDRGCSAEVYSNPDPAAYVELEMLGPLKTMKIGDRSERATLYTLSRRSERDAAEEARRLMER